MKTLLMTEIVNLTGIMPPVRLPDHSILLGTFNASMFDTKSNYLELIKLQVFLLTYFLGNVSNKV